MERSTKSSMTTGEGWNWYVCKSSLIIYLLWICSFQYCHGLLYLHGRITSLFDVRWYTTCGQDIPLTSDVLSDVKCVRTPWCHLNDVTWLRKGVEFSNFEQWNKIKQSSGLWKQNLNPSIGSTDMNSRLSLKIQACTFQENYAGKHWSEDAVATHQPVRVQ